MKIRCTLLAGASLLAMAAGVLPASGAAAQVKAAPGTAHASRAQAVAQPLRHGSPARAAAPGHVAGVRPLAYYTGLIELYDGNVLSAKACANPANVIEYPYSPNGCDGGANEIWALQELSNGYDEIVASYGGNLMCLNVKGNSYTSGTQILAWPCNNVVTGNEQFRRPENTPDPPWSADFIVPAGNYSLCLNSAGGLGTGHNIILYGCSTAYSNEAFYFPS